MYQSLPNCFLGILAISITSYAEQPLIINEFVAQNATGLEDGNGQRNDWIEIRNPNSVAIDLEGYYLTDDSDNLTKWTFPEIRIPRSGYLIVFASGNNAIDPAGNPHTNFQLSGAGEYLAIIKPDGTTVDDQFSPSFPEQFSDISYGRELANTTYGFFETPSPKTLNGNGADGVVKDTNFNFNRGFYDTSFDLEITSATPDIEIRYTTNGSAPTATSGFIYSGPITISKTSCIRAIGYRPGTNWISTNVDTQSYLFVDQVANQPENPAGWASDWGYDSQVDGQDGGRNGIVPSDYGMDPRVVDDVLNLRGPGYSIRDSLLDIPSVSISMEQLDFVASQAQRQAGAAQSLYGTPRLRFEKSCSVEYIHPDGTKGFQEDVKIETHGNSSRTPYRMQKHSLRLTFSSATGAAKLKYNLFPESPVDEFNKLVLRACFTDSWALNSWSSPRYRPNDSQYIRDVYMKDLMADMGHESGYGNFVHLYVNGLYFGLHNLTERIEDDWYVAHIGGDKNDWEINKDLEAPGTRWNQMRNIINGAIETEAVYETAQNYIDMENYIDYMALHFFADSEDWPHHNGYAAANVNSGDGKFRFQVWDQEIAFDKYTWNRYADSRGGGQPFQRLRRNSDFRMLFADRVYKHMFNGGSFTPKTAGELYMRRANEIDVAIVAESARWGDVQAGTSFGNTASSSTNILSDHYPPTINNPIYFTREQHWVTERDNILNNYLPSLHDQTQSVSFLSELRAEGLYPTIDPPNYSQLGGVVPSGFELSLTTDVGGVYFTTDGSDPRAPGGGIGETSGSFGAQRIVQIFDFQSSGWAYLDSGTAQSSSNVVVGHPNYDSSDWKHQSFDDGAWEIGQGLLGDGVITGSIVKTEVESGSLFGRIPTIYFRKSFNVTDAESFLKLEFDSIQDDGVVVYLNGHEIYRHNLPDGTIAYADFANASDNPESSVLVVSHTLTAGQLVEGENVIAIELHNESSTSSDIGIDMKLNAFQSSAAGNTLPLVQSGTVKSRSRSAAGEWSALREVEFIVGTPASSDHVVISEIMFNPTGPDAGREYIEIMNISTTDTIDFTDVAFTDGVIYTFPVGFVLAPGARAVIVQDEAAFIADYSTDGIIILPGEFENSLSNGGEELVLTDHAGEPIQNFTYFADGSIAGWPEAADGLGRSMELIDPAGNPDHGQASSWKSSSQNGGSPGSGAALPLPENLTEDLDRDGLNALAEYLYGTSDEEKTPNPAQVTSVNGSVLFSFPRHPDATAAGFTIQFSDDLVSWVEDEDSFTTAPAGSLDDGRVLERVILKPNFSKRFMRVLVTVSP